MLDILSGFGSHRQPAGIRIEVEGEEIADLYQLIQEVTVDTARDTAATATISFIAAVDETGTWPVQDDSGIAAGNAIRIDALFGDQSEEVLRGYITQVSPSMPVDRGAATVTVTCRDETFLLDAGHVRKVWGVPVPVTDTLIVTEIAANSGLLPSPDNGQGQTAVTAAQNGSDIAFLQGRAELNGYELYVREGILYFGPMQLDLDPQPAIMVYAGKKTNCIEFTPADDAHHADAITWEIAAETGAQVTAGTVSSGLELLGLTPATGAATSAGPRDWRLTRTTTPDANEARAIAQGHADREAMRIRATGELDGSLYGHVLLCGQPVGVAGIGSRYSGRYYVDTVKHSFTADGYRQQFTLLRNAFGDDLAGGGVLDQVLGAV